MECALRFEIDGNQVKCIRPEDNDAVIITFDAHLSELAPHVVALLNNNECNQLELWLKNREQIQNSSTGQAALSALPELIAEACLALGKEPEISQSLFDKLDDAIKQLSKVIASKTKVVDGDTGDQTQEMTPSEELKIKIDVIQKEL